MVETYIIDTWVNAVKIKNSLNPNIKLDVLKLQDNQGHILTVFEEKQNKQDSPILYRVLVECSLANSWSLSNEEAIGFLNTIGFNCKWEGIKDISYTAMKQLESLYALGWTNIVRDIRPAEVYVSNENEMPCPLSTLVPNYKYSDWDFLVVKQVSNIKGILDTIPDEGETTTEDAPVSDENSSESV